MKSLLTTLLLALTAVTGWSATPLAGVPATNTAAQTGGFLWAAPDGTWTWKVTPPNVATTLTNVPGPAGLASRGHTTNLTQSATNELSLRSIPRTTVLDFTEVNNATAGADLGTARGGRWQPIGNAYDKSQVTNGAFMVDFRTFASNGASAATYLVTTSAAPVVWYRVKYAITNVNPAAVSPATVSMVFIMSSNSPDAGSKNFTSSDLIHSSWTAGGLFQGQVINNGNATNVGSLANDTFSYDNATRSITVAFLGNGRMQVLGEGFPITGSVFSNNIVDTTRPQGTNGPTYLTFEVFDTLGNTNIGYNFKLYELSYGSDLATMPKVDTSPVITTNNTVKINPVGNAGGFHFITGNANDVFQIDTNGWSQLGAAKIGVSLEPLRPLDVNTDQSSFSETIRMNRNAIGAYVGLGFATARVTDWLIYEVASTSFLTIYDNVGGGVGAMLVFKRGYIAPGTPNLIILGADQERFSAIYSKDYYATNLYAAGTLNVTNGIRSMATNATVVITVNTGVTNTLTVNYRLFGVTGTSIVQTNTISALGLSRGTITQPIDIVLQPGEFIKGTSIAVAGGQAF